MLHLVYGGTFDPVHCGHLAIARAARDALRCTVRLMPAADPPHRAPPGADATQRAAMIALAIDGEPGLLLDREELLRGGRSYTVDTLAGLRARLGDAHPLAWLVGADSLLGLTGWHRWRALFDLAHLVVAERPGSGLDGALPPELADCLAGRWTDDPAALSAVPAGRVLRLRQPLHAASATQVRARVAAGAPLDGLVPAAVAAFIEEKALYRAHPVAPL
ncbi:nicotinate-nucleotide adenylyltransferase [Luteimonas sp. FCS-9]|uniref:nicotinate-nucleotide adenylyltransferase n=1 Tax=Luteimonas sp. FCS-9 TaxID=1547516 RepID=UPI00063E7F00|nr:nicotinate-nucleotide adenylyltransferase [Luteimonas sp. FCS-9]KLJ01694.1 nicotinate-nucleotide adenylyltransferase [Luteimonas sp. FCS-9]